MCGSARVYPDNTVFTTRKKQPLPKRPITVCSFTAAHFDLIIQGFFPPVLFPKASLWLFYFSITQAPELTALRQYLLCETHLCICEDTSLLYCTYNGC